MQCSDLFNSRHIIVNDLYDRYVYHYTTYETGLEYILPNGELRFSPFHLVNDPIEYQLNNDLIFMSSSCMESFPQDQEDLIRSRLTVLNKVLCFSIDNRETLLELKDHVGIDCGRGYARPRMWSQYANNHKGICLIFDRELLENEMRKHIVTKQLINDKVEYRNTCDIESGAYVFNKDLCTNDADVIKHILEYKDELLFRKIRDWRDEQEYRFILLDDNKEYVTIPYGDSLKGIVLGDKFPKSYETCLVQYSKLEIGKINWTRHQVSVMSIAAPSIS